VEVKICDTPGPRWDSFAVATATVLERLRKVRTNMTICVKYVFLCQERPSISQVRDTAVPNVICRLLVHVLGLRTLLSCTYLCWS